MPLSDHDFMKLALAEAEQASVKGEVPVGALVVLNNDIIGRGHNRCISDNSPAKHAEIIAIDEAATHLGNYRLNKCTLYVTLEPCMMCAGAIAHARLDRLVFGAHDPKTGVIKSCDQLLDRPYLNHWVKSCGGVCEDECRTMLQSFFQSRR